MRALVVHFVLLVPACADPRATSPRDKAPAVSPEFDASARAAASRDAKPTPKPDSSPTPEEAPTLSDLPPIDFAPAVDFGSATKAQISERIDLAAKYAQNQELDRALAVLAEISRANCRHCVPSIDRALADSRFEALWYDPRFIELAFIGMPGLDPKAPEPDWWSVDIGCDGNYVDDDWFEDPGFACPKGTKLAGRRKPPGRLGTVYCARGSTKQGPAIECNGPGPDAHILEPVTEFGTYRNGKRYGWWKHTPYHYWHRTGRYDDNGRQTGAWSYNGPTGASLYVQTKGVRQGPEIEYNGDAESGMEILSVSGYDRGKLHGTYSEFLDGKVRQTGIYRRGKKHGTWKLFSDDGWLRYVENFRAGTRHGAFTYYDKRGTVVAQVELENGTGPWLVLDDNDKVVEKGAFTANKRSGEWLFFDSEGRETARGSFRRDKPHGIWKMTRYGDEKHEQTLELVNGTLKKVNGKATTLNQLDEVQIEWADTPLWLWN